MFTPEKFNALNMLNQFSFPKAISKRGKMVLELLLKLTINVVLLKSSRSIGNV